MRTLLPSPPPPEFEALLEQRRRLGGADLDPDARPVHWLGRRGSEDTSIERSGSDRIERGGTR